MPKKYSNVTASDNELLGILDHLRTVIIMEGGDRTVLMQAIIDILVARKVYPKSTKTMRQNKLTHLIMVRDWGVKWHQYEFPHFCARCGGSWKDEKNGPPFKLEVAIHPEDEYREGLRMKCPHCNTLYTGREYEDIMLTQRKMDLTTSKKVVSRKRKARKKVKAVCSEEKRDNVNDGEDFNLCFGW